jgi:hypothetical protein
VSGLTTRGGSAATAYSELRLAIHEAALAVGRSHVDDFPGLLEFVEHNVLFVVGAPSGNAHGWFAAETWRNSADYASEIFINADTRQGLPAPALAAGMLTTVVHELAHVANFIMGIPDVSRQHRFHNYRFARTALTLGLEIEAHPSIGHITPGLQARTAERYAAELRSLEKALTLVWSPNPDRYLRSSTSTSKPTALTGNVQSTRKYITASCRCTRSDGSRRTIRVAAGWWILGPIRCGVCNIDFTASTGVSDNRVSKREVNA